MYWFSSSPFSGAGGSTAGGDDGTDSDDGGGSNRMSASTKNLPVSQLFSATSNASMSDDIVMNDGSFSGCHYNPNPVGGVGDSTSTSSNVTASWFVVGGNGTQLSSGMLQQVVGEDQDFNIPKLFTKVGSPNDHERALSAFSRQRSLPSARNSGGSAAGHDYPAFHQGRNPASSSTSTANSSSASFDQYTQDTTRIFKNEQVQRVLEEIHQDQQHGSTTSMAMDDDDLRRWHEHEWLERQTSREADEDEKSKKSLPSSPVCDELYGSPTTSSRTSDVDMLSPMLLLRGNSAEGGELLPDHDNHKMTMRMTIREGTTTGTTSPQPSTSSAAEHGIMRAGVAYIERTFDRWYLAVDKKAPTGSSEDDAFSLIQAASTVQSAQISRENSTGVDVASSAKNGHGGRDHQADDDEADIIPRSLKKTATASTELRESGLMSLHEDDERSFALASSGGRLLSRGSHPSLVGNFSSSPTSSKHLRDKDGFFGGNEKTSPKSDEDNGAILGLQALVLDDLEGLTTDESLSDAGEQSAKTTSTFGKGTSPKNNTLTLFNKELLNSSSSSPTGSPTSGACKSPSTDKNPQQEDPPASFVTAACALTAYCALVSAGSLRDKFDRAAILAQFVALRDSFLNTASTENTSSSAVYALADSILKHAKEFSDAVLWHLACVFPTAASMLFGSIASAGGAVSKPPTTTSAGSIGGPGSFLSYIYEFIFHRTGGIGLLGGASTGAIGGAQDDAGGQLGFFEQCGWHTLFCRSAILLKHLSIASSAADATTGPNAGTRLVGSSTSLMSHGSAHGLDHHVVGSGNPSSTSTGTQLQLFRGFESLSQVLIRLVFESDFDHTAVPNWVYL
ncbi:unnamed protein product [Amoebophrya sp. A25]|nr:unnamed protein product [Amoebophrya sp. A25]|eukprot:GSA25T00003753001.1